MTLVLSLAPSVTESLLRLRKNQQLVWVSLLFVSLEFCLPHYPANATCFHWRSILCAWQWWICFSMVIWLSKDTSACINFPFSLACMHGVRSVMCMCETYICVCYKWVWVHGYCLLKSLCVTIMDFEDSLWWLSSSHSSYPTPATFTLCTENSIRTTTYNCLYKFNMENSALLRRRVFTRRILIPQNFKFPNFLHVCITLQYIN